MRKTFIISIISILLSVSAFAIAIVIEANKDVYKDITTKDKCDNIVSVCQTKCASGDAKCISKCKCGAWDNTTCFKGTIKGKYCVSNKNIISRVLGLISSILFILFLVMLIVGLVQKFHKK